MVKDLSTVDTDPTIEMRIIVYPAGNFRLSDGGGLQC